MALSTELLKRLNCDEEPLPKRLKLAENAFHAIDLPIVRKEDLILQWLCKSCVISKDVWGTLKHCLKTEHFDIKTNIKKLLLNTFVQKFNEDNTSVCKDVLECCRLLISNTKMQQYFTTESKDLGLLIKSILCYAHKYFKQTLNIKEDSIEGIDITLTNTNDDFTLAVYNTIISVMESMIQIFRSLHASKDCLRIIFIQDILYPLCIIIDHNHTDNTNRLGAIAYKCIQQIIFGKRYVQNKAAVIDEETMVLKTLLSTLMENVKTKSLQGNIMTFVFVFRASVGIYKTDSTMLDLMFRKLVESAGIYKKEVLNYFLKHLTDVTLDYENKIDDVSLLEYCYIVIDTVLSSDCMTKIDYELLIQFSYLNPLIIDKKIQDILKKIFQHDNVTQDYTNVLIALLDVSVRLRREEKLLSHILIALKHSLNYVCKRKIDVFFPRQFEEKFIKVVNNITNSQAVSMLKTLLFHLNTNCMEVFQSDNSHKNLLMMKGTTQLLGALLDGTRIFDYTGTLIIHEKFINTFDELGNVLSVLMDKVLQSNYNEDIIVILLTSILSWSEVHHALKYYLPNDITQTLTFPTSELHWQQLIQKVTTFGEERSKCIMNKLILHRLKMTQYDDNNCIKLDGLIGGITSSWGLILQFHTEIVSSLSTKDVTELAQLLLDDMTSSNDRFSEGIKILKQGCLMNFRNFVISLLTSVLFKVGRLTKGVTECVTKHLSVEPLIDSEYGERKEVRKIIITMKKELARDEWTKIENSVVPEIQKNLEVLLHIPLVLLSLKVRIVVFLVIYSIMKECDVNEKIICLCNMVFSDLLEQPGIKIFKYIEPLSLLIHLPRNRIIQKAFERCFRNGVSYPKLKCLIKSTTHNKKTMYLLLECMSNVTSKLTIEDKTIFKKAEKKLIKYILKTLTYETLMEDDMKVFTLILRFNIANKKIDETLKNTAELTVENLFSTENHLNHEIEKGLTKDDLDLAVLVLRNQKIFHVSNETKKRMGYTMLKQPYNDLLIPLLESSEPKEFREFLDSLHIEMEQNLFGEEEKTLQHTLVIWNIVLKMNMSAQRSKSRSMAIAKLIQTMQTVRISKVCWPCILKLLQSILVSKHLHLPGSIIDVSIVLGLESLEQINIESCSDVLMLCGILVKVRTSLITDRLPALLSLYKHVIDVVVSKSKAISDRSEEMKLIRLAVDIEKCTSSLVKLKKDMARLSPYLIADLLTFSCEVSIAAFMKASVQNCISQLISTCDPHGIGFLSRNLPVSMQEIFKTQLDTFKKFYKFSGKI